MKIQKPQYEIWMQNPGELGIYQQIERAGRVCYKSENNTTEDSAKPFVGRMIEHEHYAMLEHGTVYLTCNHVWPPFCPIYIIRCDLVIDRGMEVEMGAR